MRPPVHIVALVVLVVVPAMATPAGTEATVAATTATDVDDVDVDPTVLRGESSVLTALDDASAVRQARADGRLYENSYPVPGEVAVFRFQSRELNRSVADASGSTTTARFFAALNATNATVRVVQQNPPVERQRFQVALRESEVRVVRDPATATFWLALDTADPVLTTTDGEPLPDREIEPGVELQFRVTGPTDEVPSITERVAFVEFEATDTVLTGDVTPGTPLYADANGTLRVSIEAPTFPGEDATVRLRARNGTVLDRTGVSAASVPELVRTRVTGTLSLDVLAPNDPFVVEVVARNRTLFRRSGLVGEPPTLSNVTAVRLPNGSTRVGATVRYPAAGFLYVDLESSAGDVHAVPVPGDERTRVDLLVEGVDLREEVYVVAWRDTDGDGQFAPDGNHPDDPWTVDGSILDASTRVRPATPTATATVHSLETATATVRTKPSPTVPAPGTTSGGTATSVGGPGFGVVTALGALGGLLVLLQLRR